MSVRRYLPSAQFAVMALSLLIAGGAVTAAQWYTERSQAGGSLASTKQTTADGEWQQSLADIQAQSGVNLPDAPSQDAVDSLVNSSQSSNLTDSIGRGVLARLATAGVQGLGDDIPTQESIIAAASAQLNTSPSSKAPTLTVVAASDIAMRAYGNGVMVVLGEHTKANSNDVLHALALATDNRDSSQLAPLSGIGAEYRALARDLAKVPVPKTLSPLHAQVVGDLNTIADTFPDMMSVVDDPLRGLTALQRYQTLLNETGRVFTNIADALNKGGILFSKDEPGSAWSNFTSP